jgi:hypothetical protein
VGDRSQTASASMGEREGTTVDAAAAPSRGGEEVLVGYALTEKKRRSLFSPELLAYARCAIGRPRSTRVADTSRRVTRLSLSLFLGEYFQPVRRQSPDPVSRATMGLSPLNSIRPDSVRRSQGVYFVPIDPRLPIESQVRSPASVMDMDTWTNSCWRNIPSDRYFVSD